MITNTGYDLYIIEETPTPLAALPIQPDAFLPVAVCMVMAVLVILAGAYYLWRCGCYRRRIAVIRQFGTDPETGYSGWNLFKLKREAEELEERSLRMCEGVGN